MKKMPDYSLCKDPEFAKALWQMKQIHIENARAALKLFGYRKDKK